MIRLIYNEGAKYSAGLGRRHSLITPVTDLEHHATLLPTKGSETTNEYWLQSK